MAEDEDNGIIVNLDDVKQQRIDDLVDASLKDPRVLLTRISEATATHDVRARRKIKSLEEDLEKRPEDVGLLHELAGTLSDLRDFNPDWTAEIYKRIILLDPENARAYSELGAWYFIFKEDSEKAERCLLKALAFSSQDRRVYAVTLDTLAELYLEEKDLEKAMRSYQEILKVDISPMQKIKVAKAYLENGRIKEGILLAEDAKAELENKLNSNPNYKKEMKREMELFTDACRTLIYGYNHDGRQFDARRLENEALKSPYLDIRGLKSEVAFTKLGL